jgi:hypothetical protein
MASRYSDHYHNKKKAATNSTNQTDFFNNLWNSWLYFGNKSVAVKLSLIERDIAREIASQGIPIRGAEVQFVRKSGLSMEKFGRHLVCLRPRFRSGSAHAPRGWRQSTKRRSEP